MKSESPKTSALYSFSRQQYRAANHLTSANVYTLFLLTTAANHLISANGTSDNLHKIQTSDISI